MESAREPAFMESAATAARNQRPRLLHSWGVSLLTIAHKALQRVEQLNCPLGFLLSSLAAAMASMASPIQHHCLSILSFIDDQILAVENAVMSFFPSSATVFDEIDKLALFSETLPQKFDHVIDKFKAILRQLPLLAWYLNMFAELKKSSDEKEISVDIHCDEPLLEEEPKAVMEGEPEDAAVTKLNLMEGELHPDTSGYWSNGDDIVEAQEALNRGEIEEKDAVKEVIDYQKKISMNHDEVPEQHQQCSNEVFRKDSILDLFDEVWVKK